MRNDIIQVRVPTEMRQQADAVFAAIGLKTGEAVRVFLQQSINSGGLPFQPHVKTPNAETRAAMRESEEGGSEAVTLDTLRKEMGLPPQ